MTWDQRKYQYHYKPDRGKPGWWVAVSRDEWLNAVMNGLATPKAPPSWIEQQTREGRTPVQASIIWGRAYDRGRKRLIWDMATEEDFRALGYLEG